jgi:hypothetical protein
MGAEQSQPQPQPQVIELPKPDIRELFNKKISYSQPPKKPDPAIGIFSSFDENNITVIHNKNKTNIIPINYPYEVTNLELTDVPMLESIKIGSLLLKLNDNISYKIEHTEPNPAIGKIVGFSYDKDKDIYEIQLEHKNGTHSIFEGFSIDHSGKRKSNKIGITSSDITNLPVEVMKDGEKEFRVGDKVSYVYTKSNETFDVVGIITSLFVLGSNNIGVWDGVNDSRFSTTDIKISDTFRPSELTVVSLDTPLKYKNKNVEKKSSGNKKYTLENEYRVKYAKYKAKYLLQQKK